MLESEISIDVLTQAAASARRLSSNDAIRIIRTFLRRADSDEDVTLNLMLWWAVESHASEIELIQDQLVLDTKIWQNEIARRILFPNLVRRWLGVQSPSSMAAVANLMKEASRLDGKVREEAGAKIQSAFEKAYEGRSLAGVSNDVIESMVALGQASLALRMRRGDLEAMNEASRLILDNATSPALRMQMGAIGSELRSEPIRIALFGLVQSEFKNDDMLVAFISALSNYDHAMIADLLIKRWPKLDTKLRIVAGAVLASRQEWSSSLIEACERGQIDRASLPVEAIRAMRMLPDPMFQAKLSAMFPELAGLNFVDAQAKSQSLVADLLQNSGDPYRGKKLFNLHCARCHKLFDEGGEVGPDLTGYQRDQTETLARNIIAPSLEIREGYQSIVLVTNEDQVLTGFIEHQDDRQVAIRGIDGRSHHISREDIQSIKTQTQSLMPETILDSLRIEEVRDMFSYLRSSQPLSDQ